MKIRALLILTLFFALSGLKAQPPETIYLGTLIASGENNDVSYGPFNIGFNFTYFGNSYSQFYVSTNGLILFGTGSTSALNADIPSATAPNNFIAGFWDDLMISFTGKILYSTIGAAPNRKLVIQFVNMDFVGPTRMFGSFSVILYESTNRIQVQYRLIADNVSTRSHGSSATIGLENSTGAEGVKYSYNTVSVSNEQAILFTPSGGTYNVDSNALYDGVNLTTNLTLPEPGITTLLSPAPESVIGSNHTFEWAPASDAASYTLYISHRSSLSMAQIYSAGTNLSYDITGLTLDTTYYWGVFATNATGQTWCEIKRFTTSSTPPLAAVPATVWAEQSQDKTIKLNYTGGDASPKTAIITSLPNQGTLWQYNAGVKGAQITAVPTTVTDANRNVIYTAPAASGNGIGNFNFKMNDAGGDSPEATITVNVSPPGIPSVLYIAKGSGVEIQFDRIMSDPVGKQNQFTVTVNGTPATLTSASLKTGDPYTISLGCSPALQGTETVSVAYTQGDVTSLAGGFLLSFTDQPVTLRSQTINFTQTLDKKYNESPFNLTATASSGLGMTYSSSNLTVATISSNVVTLKALGNSDITARQAGNATWAPAKYVRTMTVAKGDQTITFSPITARTYGDADFAFSAVASSLLLVAGSSSNTSVATVTGNTIHIVGAGTTTITASQSGNALWNAAPDVQQPLVVNKATLTAIADDKTRVYGEANPAFTITYSGFVLGENTAVLDQLPTANCPTANPTSSPGTYPIVVTGGNDNNYTFIYTDGVLAIGKADQTITFPPIGAHTYGDTDFTLSAVASSGLLVAGSSSNTSVATVTGNTVHITGAGTTIITASQAGDTNYNPATDVQQTLTVSKGDQTITFGPLLDQTFGAPDFSLFGTASSGLAVSYVSSNPAVATVTGSTVHIVGVGSTTITASQPGDANYNAAADVSQTLNVFTANATITLGSLSATYDGLAHPATATTSPAGLTVLFTYDGSATPPVDAGSYTVAASISDGSYHGSASGTLIISKADQTITFPAIGVHTYGDSDFTLSAVAGSGLLVAGSSSNTNVATVTGNSIHIVGAGSTVITASQSGDANWNAAPDVQQTLTVNKKDLTVTADNKTRAYGAADPAFTITYSGFVLGEDTSVLDGLPTASCPTANSSSPPGTYPIIAAGGTDNSYTYIYTDGVLTIVKADQTIAFPSIGARSYGDADFTLSAVAGSGLLVAGSSSNTSVATVTGNTVHIVAAGTTVITASQAGDANWNAAPDVQQTLTVNKKDLPVTADNKTRAYGASDPVYTITYSGFVSGETTSVLDVLPTANCPTANSSSSPGSYPIEVNGGSDNNYTYIYIYGVLTIVKADQTITFPPIPAKVYGDADFTLSAGAGSLLLVTYTSSNTAVATVSGNSVHITGAGTTVIIASQAGNANYNAAPDVQQTLTVNKANQTITISAAPARLLVGDSYTLAATSTAGLPVLFESSDPLLATISGDQVTGVSKGNVTLRAYNAGNSNYNQAEATVTMEIYSTHKDILNLFTPNGDGFNDYWELPEMATWGNCDVRVYNRWGKLVYANKNYDNLWDGTSNGNPLPEGAYYFIIETENSGVKKGTLNIVR